MYLMNETFINRNYVAFIIKPTFLKKIHSSALSHSVYDQDPIVILIFVQFYTNYEFSRH